MTEAHAPGERALASEATRVLDTVGTQAALDTALDALARGGVCASVALRPGENRFKIAHSRLLWSRTLRGVIEGDAHLARDIPRLVALWRVGALPIERIVTGVDFADAASAIARMRSGEVVKAVLRMEPSAVTDAVAAPRAATPAATPAAMLLAALRDGTVPDAELAGLWSSLPPVHPHELRGLWRGWPATRTHRTRRLLERQRWYGKHFASNDEVAPLVCLDDDGRLRVDTQMARGGATLREGVHEGLRTAVMAYDALPIVDAFVRIGADAVLGVMTGRDTRDEGVLFHFVLEADPAREGELLSD